jgi:tRNA-splicing ligase RtcB (3'-phosphate/5'-hydroxy nucleic acid ligase)
MALHEVNGHRVPIRIWTDPATVEVDALAQLGNIADLPWVHGLAVMPDVHLGKGATVGSVIAMRDAVCPAAVGVDIGCGMTAVRTSLTAQQLPDDLGPLRQRLEAAVPVGFNGHPQALDFPGVTGNRAAWERFWDGFGQLNDGVSQLRDRARIQMGTLGGGNHFIEVCVEQGGLDAGRVWLMLHSGSRNIGKELAERHIAVAKSLSHNAGLPDTDLAVFLMGTPELEAYRRDLYWAQDYARRNRQVMMALVQREVAQLLSAAQPTFDQPISCHHNYVSEERYDGVDLLVTRKGAIRAGQGELGIIPGSMGTGSYITRGLGNVASYCSASHGAGRRMSRNAARRTFQLSDLLAQTSGVECRKDAGVIDEIPGAYKDIEQVMADQADLVQIVAHLRQVLCVKG